MGVILPTVEKAGIDLVWFGIFIVLVVEMAQITPPVGFNLFVLQGMTGRQITWIARNALPMFYLMIVATLLLYFFPALVTFLAAPDETRMKAMRIENENPTAGTRAPGPFAAKLRTPFAVLGIRVSGSAVTGVEYLPLSERAIAPVTRARGTDVPADRALPRRSRVPFHASAGAHGHAFPASRLGCAAEDSRRRVAHLRRDRATARQRAASDRRRVRGQSHRPDHPLPSCRRQSGLAGWIHGRDRGQSHRHQALAVDPRGLSLWAVIICDPLSMPHFRALKECVTPGPLNPSFPRKRESSVLRTNATGSPLSRG